MYRIILTWVFNLKPDDGLLLTDIVYQAGSERVGPWQGQVETELEEAGTLHQGWSAFRGQRRRVHLN